MGRSRAKTTHHQPDWEIVGKHPSGAMLVARVGGSGHPHKCCPRCLQGDALSGPLTGCLMECGAVLACPDCGLALAWRRTPADDGVRLFASVDGGKWHVLGQEHGAWLEAACKLRVRGDAAFVRAWGEVEADDLCGTCMSAMRSVYGETVLEGIGCAKSAPLRGS